MRLKEQNETETDFREVQLWQVGLARPALPHTALTSAPAQSEAGARLSSATSSQPRLPGGSCGWVAGREMAGHSGRGRGHPTWHFHCPKCWDSLEVVLNY